MIGNIIGALIGSKFDKNDGEGGVKGALIGAATVGVARRLGPLALLIGGVMVAKSIMKRTAGTTTDV